MWSYNKGDLMLLNLEPPLNLNLIFCIDFATKPQLHTVYAGKIFEWENFCGWYTKLPFTGKLSRCIRPWYCTQQVI